MSKQQYTRLVAEPDAFQTALERVMEAREEQRVAEDSSWLSDGNGAAMNVEWDE